MGIAVIDKALFTKWHTQYEYEKVQALPSYEKLEEVLTSVFKD